MLEWGKNNYRYFPWRATRNPLHLLVAEILLSKTPAWRVEQIYDRVIKTYSSARLLAEASKPELTADIESLGLHNKRAEQLIEIAKALLEIYNGKVPRDAHQLIELPGVGPYIAYAVQCFAYDESVPIVDSNIGRVLTRFFALDYQGRPNLDKRVLSSAATLVPKSSRLAKKYNYGLLDFAALVCTTKPRCHSCPVAEECSYFSVNSNKAET